MDFNFMNKGMATLSVCTLGVVSMEFTGGQTGIGWAVLGVFFIWSND